MRTTLGRVRRLLAEAIDLDQAYVGSTQPGEEPVSDELSAHSDLAQHKQQVNRFFKAQKFHDDAITLYRNLSVPVYVVPVWSYKNSDVVTGGSRYSVMDDPQELVRFGISQEQVDELEVALEGGATAFAAQVATLEKGNLPTPWMIVHALFDNGSDEGSGEPLLAPIADKMYNADAQEAFEDEEGRAAFMRGLTMGSARKGDIGSYYDMLAEILTQAVLTTKGFVPAETGDDLIDNQLRRLQRVVAPARAAFEQAVAGKVLVIGVHLVN